LRWAGAIRRFRREAKGARREGGAGWGHPAYKGETRGLGALARRGVDWGGGAPPPYQGWARLRRGAALPNLNFMSEELKQDVGAADLKPLGVEDLARLRLPVPVKHPRRVAIEGLLHLVPEVQAEVSATEGLPAGLKDFLKEELAALKSNGAAVDLHLVDHADGSGSLVVHWRPVRLGRS